MMNYDYEDVQVGQVFIFNEYIDDSTINMFVELSGNDNPLHTDSEYAKTVGYSAKIVHGLHLSLYFSKLFGIFCPGKKCLCLSQNLNFVSPVYSGTSVTIKGIITRQIDGIKGLEMKTEIWDSDGNLCVDGTALVKFL